MWTCQFSLRSRSSRDTSPGSTEEYDQLGGIQWNPDLGEAVFLPRSSLFGAAEAPRSGGGWGDSHELENNERTGQPDDREGRGNRRGGVAGG